MASAARSARLPTISEWWYVPGVSTSRRRSSGWDGFASSSSWNTVTIPNTEPITAKLPTAATAEPPADRADAPSSSSRPRMSCSPSSAKMATTRALTTSTAMPAWTNTASRSPRRTATIPAIPPSIT